MPRPSTIPVVGDKSLKTQYQVSYVPVEAMEVDPAAIKGNPRAPPTMSPASVRSCPGSRLCSQSVCRVARLAAHLASIRAHVPVLASQVVITGLAALTLAEPISSAATVHSAVCHHDPDRLHPGQLAAGAWHPGRTPRPSWSHVHQPGQSRD